MGPIQSVEDLLGLLRRRFWLIVAVTVIGFVLAVTAAKTRVDVYESTAVIQVEVPVVAEGAGGSVQFLQTIQQRLTSREALLAMIERHGLFADAPALTPDQRVAALRASIQFEPVASTAAPAFGAASPISALVIVAQSSSADHAARIANDLAQGILDQTNAGQLDSARETTSFFRTEEARVWQQLAALEAEIAAYKNEHSAALPDMTTARTAELAAIGTDLREVEQRLVALEEQRRTLDTGGALRATTQRQLDALRSQIAVATSQRATLLAERDALTAALAAAPEVERVLSGYARRLTQLQSEYDVVTARMAEAETAQRLAESQQSGRFSLLERALTPEFPIGSGGKTLVIAGTLASLIGGLLLALLLDLLNPVIRTAAQMERLLSLRPVVVVPDIAIGRSRQLSPVTRLIDDPTRPILGLPRFAVMATAAALLLLVLSALLG
jgi:tyrosine-protein kinase Etk/Wzc